jgi:hypothetical protein
VSKETCYRGKRDLLWSKRGLPELGSFAFVGNCFGRIASHGHVIAEDASELGELAVEKMLERFRRVAAKSVKRDPLWSK